MNEHNMLLTVSLVVFASLFLLVMVNNIVLVDKINDLESRIEIALQDVITTHGGSLKGLCSLHPECQWLVVEPEPTYEGMV